jgi:hypothetical protein
MGKLIVYCGPLGQGQMVKLIGNAVAADNAAVVGQALLAGSPDRRRSRRTHDRGGRRLGRLDDAGAEAPADARARLHDSVEARAPA